MEKALTEFSSIQKIIKERKFQFFLLPETFKKHPHVYEKLDLLWGTKEFLEYVKNLMTYDRETRDGFSISVLGEIVAIQEAHQKAFPYLVKIDIWDEVEVFDWRTDV
jgi:hypothetical protein